MDTDMAWRVPGGWLQANLRANLVGEIYQVGKAMLEDRADRVVHDVVGIIGIGLAVPIFKFLFGDEITSIGKGRYPLAIH